MRPPFRPLRFQFPEEPKANRANPLKLTGKPKKAFFQRTIRKAIATFFTILPQRSKKEDQVATLNLSSRSGRKGNNLDLVKKHGRPRSWRTKISLSSLLLLNVHGPIYGGSRRRRRFGRRAFAKYPIDPDKVYLTGLSQGGFGTWATAAQHPEKFAAVAPVCGGKPNGRNKSVPFQIRTFMGMPTNSYQSV